MMRGSAAASVAPALPSVRRMLPDTAPTADEPMPRAVFLRLRRRLSEPLVRHALLYAAGKFVPAGCALTTIALLVRVLGREEFGRYALASANALFWANAGSIWLSQSILRFQSRFSSSRFANHYSRFLRSSTALCGVIAAVSAAMATLVSGASVRLALGTALLSAAEATIVVEIATSQARIQPGIVIALEGAKSVAALGSLALVAMLSRPSSAPKMIWAVATGELLVAIACLIRRRSPASSMTPLTTDRGVVRASMLRFALPIACFSLLSYALTVSDRFLIARWNGLSDAGAYSGVFDTVYRSFGLLLFPVLLAAHPLVAQAWNKGDSRAVRRALRQAVALEVMVGLPLVFALALAHRRVVLYALGGAVPHSFLLVLSIGVAALLWQVGQVLHKPSEMSGRLGVLLGGVLVALIVNVASNRVWLPGAPVVVAGCTSALASAAYVAVVVVAQRAKSHP